MRRTTGGWLLALSFALGACGGAASSRPGAGYAQHGGGAPSASSPTAWALQRCGREGASAMEVGRTADATFVVHGSDRIVLTERGGRRAVEVPIDPIGAAAMLGNAWYFWTAGGVILRAAGDFLGPLSMVARAPRESLEPIVAEGALVVRLHDRSFWFFEPESGARPIPLPADRRALAVALRWPDLVAVLVEPGALLVSHDRGATFAPLDVGPHAVLAVGVEPERVWLATDDETFGLTPSDGLEPTPRPATSEQEPFPAGHGALDLRVDAFLAPTDGWCDRRTPLELTPAPSGTIAPSEDELEGDCTLSSGADVGPLLSVCRAEEGGAELRRWDPEVGSWSAIAELGRDPLGCSFVGASGSPAFVIDVFGTRRFYDGVAFVPLTLDPSIMLIAASDDLAFARGPIGDDYGVFLVRLPSGVRLPLELPDQGRTVLRGDFAGDGTLALHTRDGDRHFAILGSPGAWSVHALPDHVADVAWATHERGMAIADGVIFTTDDSGAHWARSEVRSEGSTSVLRCSRDGCVLPGVAMLRTPPPDGARVVIDARSELADASAPPTATEPPAARWECEWPRTTRWSETSTVSVGAAGWVATTGDARADGTVPIAWGSVDAHGAFRSTGAIAARYDAERPPVAIARGFVVMRGEGTIEIGSEHPHAIPSARLGNGLDLERAEMTAMRLDERVLVTVRSEDALSTLVERVLLLDAAGEVAATRTYLWSDPWDEQASFSAADGRVGRAVHRFGTDEWTLHPMDGTAATSLSFPSAAAPCGVDAGPWTIALDHPHVLLQSRSASRLGTQTTNVVQVADGRACVAAVAQPMRAPEAVGFAFTSHGRIHAVTLDLEGHTSPMRCTATDE